MSSEINIKEVLFGIASETEKYDFPFFSSNERKKEIIEEKKKDLDERLIEILRLNNYTIPEMFISDHLWKKSEEKAKKQLGNENDNYLNGFYLQELLHTYVEENIRLLNEERYKELLDKRVLE